MQWLIPHPSNDRGAVAVLVAVLMVPLIGFAALSVDLAAVHADKQQLQTGADAAALAIAQDCARSTSTTSCGPNPVDTAQNFAGLNKHDGNVVSRVSAVPLPSTGRVTVTSDSERHHWFAPVLGVNSTSIRATSTAGWGAPIAGTANLPLVFSWCEFKIQTGGGLPSETTEHTISLPKKSETGCNGPSGNPVPGGFGWVDRDIEDGQLICNVTSRIGERLSSDPGKNVPCSAQDLANLRNAVALLPIFDDADGEGTNAWYEVHGYAAFKITGYFFGDQYSWNAPCTQPDHCIRGYFTRFIDTSNDYEYSPTAPNMGAVVVGLLP